MKKSKFYGYQRVLILMSLFFIVNFLPGTPIAAGADFPNKPITIVVCYGPGGMRDIAARGVGITMSKYLGVPVIVKNLPGAGGARGMTNIYHAEPDGYTFGVSMGTDIVSQIVKKVEFDNTKYTVIGRIQRSPGFFLVKSDSPIHSIKDFKTFGKPVRHSTFSLFANSTILPMILADREGWELITIGGYRGAAAANLAVVRGEVEFAGAGLSSLKPYWEAKQIRVIMTIDQNRSPEFPNIPTIVEEGYPELADFALDLWFVGPPEIPKSRAKILENALKKTAEDPEFLKWAKKAGVDVAYLNGADMRKTILELFNVFKQYKQVIQKYIKK
jgi:tripartite-type tricarboxylate transporter receptor subunit TctC